MTHTTDQRGAQETYIGNTICRYECCGNSWAEITDGQIYDFCPVCKKEVDPYEVDDYEQESSQAAQVAK